MEQRKCVDCGKTFILSDSEIRFYMTKGLQLPKRCASCRASKSNRPDPVKLDYIPANTNSYKSKSDSISLKTAIPILSVVLILGFGAIFFKYFRNDTLPSDSLYNTQTTYLQMASEEYETAADEEAALAETPTSRGETSSAKESSNAKTSSFNTTSAATSAVLRGYSFRSDERADEHFSKHGTETRCASLSEYIKKANAVISDPDSLMKYEAEDGDLVYFNKTTGEIVFLSTDNYIRTYFIADYDYFEGQ